MFTGLRCTADQRAWRPAQRHRLAHEVDYAEYHRMHRLRDAEVAYVRVGKRLIDFVDWTARDSSFVHPLNQSLNRHCRGDIFDQSVEAVAIYEAHLLGRVVGVLNPFRATERGAEP